MPAGSGPKVQIRRYLGVRACRYPRGFAPDSPALAQVYLYRGLVLLDRADAAQAAADLERASSLAPQLVDPAATYFAGLAWQAAADRERAQQALRRVIEQAPGTVWAREAELALEQRVRKRRAWGRVFGGMEYDSNVRLRGQGVFLFPGQGDEADGRGFWGIDAGTELFRNQNWAGGVATSYYGNAQIDLTDFDVQFPTGFVWLDRAIGETSFARLQLDAGFGWVGYDPFLFPLSTTLSGHHNFKKAGAGRGFFQYGLRDYRYTINTVDAPPAIPPADVKKARNRDGNWYQAGYDHAYPWRRALLQAGLAGGRYDSHREYTHSAFLVWLGAQVNLPWDSIFDASGSYTGEWYDHPSTFRDPVTGTFPTKDRQDDIWLVRAAIEKRITDWLSVTARYLYSNSDSNTKVYDYDRHIIGGYFTIWLGERQERRTWDNWRKTL